MLAKTFIPPARGVKPSAMGFKNCVFVDPGDDVVAKYDWLKSSDRDAKMGALAIDNERTLFLTPGTYTVTTNLVFDADHVNIVGLSGCMEDTVLDIQVSSGIGVKISGFNHEVRNINFKDTNGNAAPAVQVDSDHAFTAVTGADSGSNTQLSKTNIGVGIGPGDEVYIVSGTGVTPGWYPVVSVTDDDTIIIDDINGGSQNDIVCNVISHHNWIENCKFTHSAFTPLGAFNKLPLTFNGFSGGTVKDCLSSAGGFRISNSTSNVQMRITFINCSSLVDTGQDGIAVGTHAFFGDATGSSFSGKAYNCKTGYGGFGGCSSFGVDYTSDAIIMNCEAGENSYALAKDMAGKLYNCIGGGNCFAGNSGTLSGEMYGCIDTAVNAGSTSISVVTSGAKIIGCQFYNFSGNVNLTNALISDCILEITTADRDCFILEDSNSKIYNTTITVSGTGIPINDDGSARNVVAAHCRMNNASNDADGLGTNVTNLIGTLYNVVDDDIS